MALLTYHSARRGFLGFLTYITGSDNVSRGGVIPAMTLVSSAGLEIGTTGNPGIPTTSANPATITTGQLALTANARGQLPSNALANGIIIKSDPANTAKVMIGGAGVIVAADGTGAGYILSPGEAASFGVTNTNAIYAISSSAAVLSYEGN